MLAPRRRPTIRRVRDWEPSPLATTLRAPRVPLDLVPMHDDVRETIPMFSPLEEDDAATLARIVPANSETRALLEDPEQTLAYIRAVQASIPDPDAALESLVAVYEDRIARLAREREQAEERAAAERRAADERRRKAEEAAKRSWRNSANRTLVKMQPHVWKIVYATICVWGLLQLALMR